MKLEKFKKRSGEIIKLAIPVVGEMILYMLIWVFDTLMVGNYGGKTAVSAVGFSSEIMASFSNMLIIMGVALAMTSIIARSLGARDVEKAQKITEIGLKIGGIVSVILFLIFFIFPYQILKKFGANDEVLSLAYGYMKICSIGIFFNMLSSLLNSIYRGAKNTKIPLYGALILNVVNISLDYVLIFGKFGFPEMGIEGAAIATTTGNIFAFIFLVYKIKRIPFKISLKNSVNFNFFKELVKLAGPSGLQEGAFSMSRLLCITMIISLGSLSFSANQIATTLESVSFMPGWGFSIATVTLVGHSIGERNIKKAREYTNTSIILSLIIMGSVALLFLVIPEMLVTIFVKKEEIDVIKLGATCLRIGSIQQFPLAIYMILSGALKGAGDTKTPFRIVVICNWFIRLPLVYYFIYLNKMPITYYWWITTLQWTIEALIFIKIYRNKFYKNIDSNNLVYEKEVN